MKFYALQTYFNAMIIPVYLLHLLFACLRNTSAVRFIRHDHNFTLLDNSRSLRIKIRSVHQDLGLINQSEIGVLTTKQLNVLNKKKTFKDYFLSCITND